MTRADAIPAAGIPAAELEERRERLLEQVRARGASGYVLFDQSYIQYLTGFWFLSNERPIAFAQTTSGDSAIFVPEFEVARTREEGAFERIDSYREYPGLEHPMVIFGRVLEDLGMSGQVAADQDGYPGILGYQGPALSTVTGATVSSISDTIEAMLARKSANEIALIRESGRWCAHAHRLLQEYTRPGVTEAEASLRAGQEATLAMLEALGARFGGQLGSSDGASAGYRGQIGRRSAWAHAIAHNIRFEPGDMLVTETGAPVWGYNAELERAMIIGPPTDEQRRLFDHVVERRRSRSMHCGRGSRPPRSTARSCVTSRTTICFRTGGSTRGTQSGCATTKPRSSTSATTHGSRPAWFSRSSRASTTTSSAASATPTPCSSSKTASSSSRRTRATSKA